MKKLVMALGLAVAILFAGNAEAFGGRSSVKTRTVTRSPIVSQRIVTSNVIATPVVTQQIIAQPVYTQAIVAQPAAIVNGCHVGGVSTVQRVRVR